MNQLFRCFPTAQRHQPDDKGFAAFCLGRSFPYLIEGSRTGGIFVLEEPDRFDAGNIDQILGKAGALHKGGAYEASWLVAILDQVSRAKWRDQASVSRRLEEIQRGVAWGQGIVEHGSVEHHATVEAGTLRRLL